MVYFVGSSEVTNNYPLDIRSSGTSKIIDQCSAFLELRPEKSEMNRMPTGAASNVVNVDF